MRKSVNIFKILAVCMMVILGECGLASKVCAAELEKDNPEQMIYQFAEYVNSKDIDGYVNLFEESIQKEMKEYIETIGTEHFFAEKNREIISIQKYDINTAIEEQKIFEDVLVYKVNEYIEYTDYDLERTSFHVSGRHDNIYVFVKANDMWKLFRVSTSPDEEVPTEYVEPLNASASITNPLNTTIYFTKSSNYNYYGVRTKSLSFSSYLTNVIPEEWIVSYFGQYPAYGYAGAMASKMYAWYYTVHPKWNYSPFNACMKDNSSDQNYLYNSYASLASTYKTYENNVLMYIDRLAMVSSGTNDIFELHYHATDGSYHSGQLSASGALSKAMNGDSYDTILRYYYDNSSYIGTSNVIRIINY